jgi:hypothetical protein
MPSTFTNTIHIRDFVLNVVPDRTRSQSENSRYFEIHTDINVCTEDEVSDSIVIVEPIHACIRTYLPSNKRSLYVPNAFFYADGRFNTIITKENNLEIIVQALSIERYDCFAILFHRMIYHLTFPS